MANGQDSFFDTAGVTIASHTSTNITGDASNGGTWTVHSQFSPNTMQISNANRCKNGSASVNATIYHSAAAGNDCSVKCVIHVFSNTGNVGVCGRMATGANTYYRAVFTNGTGWQLFKIVAGSQSQLGSTAGGTTLTVGNDVNLELKMSGTTISVIVDGTTLITATDSAITSGVSGIRMNGSTSDSAGYHIDNWQTVDATTTYTQTVSASTICGAAVVKQDQKAVSAAVTCVAIAVRLIQLIRSASVTSNAAVLKLASIIRAVSTTCAAAISTVKVKLLTVSAAVTSSAVLVKSVGAIRSAAATCPAASIKTVSATRSAAVGSAAVVVKMTSAVRAAASTCSAFATKALLAVRSAAATTTALCRKAISASRSGSVTTTGAVVKSVFKITAAAVTCTALAALLKIGGQSIGIACGTLALRAGYSGVLALRAKYAGTLTKRKCQ